MKRVGVRIACPRLVVVATCFATGTLSTSILDSINFRLPLLAFLALFKAIEACSLALLSAISTLRACNIAFFSSISAFRLAAFPFLSSTL